MRVHLQQIARAVDERTLAAGVAHDLNNRLTIIRSSVDFLRRPNLADERRQRSVSGIIDRAAKLVGQLFAFAQRRTRTREVLDVRKHLHLLADPIAGSRIRIVKQLCDHPYFVKADVSQFETAVVDLAVDARRHGR